MPSRSCRIYGLFISCIVSLALGIGTLVTNIVFNYIGFVNSDVVLGLCVQTYFMDKYKFLQIHLQTAFVGICLDILMNCITLPILIVTLKNFKAANLNPQLQSQKLPQSVISKVKIIAIYIMLSFGTLGSIIAFGYYLSLYLSALKDPSTCSFSYNDGNLLILMIIVGASLLGMIVEQIFTLLVNNCVSEEDIKQERQNKYKQMINVTQQPGVPNQYGYPNNKAEENMILKGAEFTQQQSNGQLHSFGNQRPFISKTYQGKQAQNDKESKKIQPFILKDMDSSQIFKPHQDTPTNFGGLSNNNIIKFGNSAGKAGKDEQNRVNTNETLNPQRFYSRKDEEPDKRVNSDVSIPSNNNFNTNTNQNSQGGNQNKSPGKFYNSINNPNSLQNPFSQDTNISSIRKKPYQNQPQYSNPFSKPLSPIKRLNESALDNHQSYTPSPIKDDPFKNVEMFTVPEKRQPQRTLNTKNGQDGLRLEMQDVDENNNGQLMFHMKAVEQDSKPNRLPEPYRNDIQRFGKNSSGEVSFKSPSRFDSKFAEEQSKFLSRNTPHSILPALNRMKQSEGSRRNSGLNENYSSGGINSYFAQSRGTNNSPESKFSKTKAREGVLTSFIRGKFA